MGPGDKGSEVASDLQALREKRRELEAIEGDFTYSQESLATICDLVAPELTRNFAEVENVSGKTALSVGICELGLSILASFTVDCPKKVAPRTDFLAQALSFEPSEDVRVLAADCLRIIAEEDASEVTEVLVHLFDAVNDSSWKVRQHSLSALTEAPEQAVDLPEVGTAIETRLEDDMWLVRAAAAKTVSALGVISPESVETTREQLIAALGDEEPDVRREAGVALARIAAGDPLSTVKRIDRLAIEGSPPRKRAGALRCADELCSRYPEHSTQLTSTVVTGLFAESEKVRSAAADVLETFARLLPGTRDRIVDELIEALDDDDWTVSSAAARGLAIIAEGFPERAEAFVDPLLSTLSRDSVLTRYYCGRSIARFVDAVPEVSEKVEAELTNRLMNGSLELRKSVASVCHEMDSGERRYSTSILSNLTRELTTGSPDGRAGAASGIAAMAYVNPELLEGCDPKKIAQPLLAERSRNSTAKEQYTRQMIAAAVLFAIEEDVFNTVPGVVREAHAILTETGTSASSEVRIFATRAISQDAVFTQCESPESVVEYLLEMLSDPEDEVRLRAVSGLATATEHYHSIVAHHLGALENAVFDPVTDCRSAAVDAIGNIGSQIPRLRRRCLRSLAYALQDEPWQVQSEAIAGFHEIATVEIGVVVPYLSVLVNCLHHQHDLVGERSADTISRIIRSRQSIQINRALVPDLEQLLSHPQITPGGRTIAVELLSLTPSQMEG